MRSPSLFNRLRYKHLHMLVALSSSQNLHRASQALNMSQPAATRMLREIEDMFGCDLFERLPRGMRPTALGQELIRFAESALSGLDRCAEDLIARQQGWSSSTSRLRTQAWAACFRAKVWTSPVPSSGQTV